MSPSQSSSLAALARSGRLPSGLREPLGASVTLWEATAPVKLPTSRGPAEGSPPPGLAPRVPRLPPILHKPRPRPTTSWSKAPRGLFVLPRVAGIFTGIPISPSPLSRQRPDRSTFRAGRNLPDKEFRYLRTVIVTAAVYRGFGSPREQLPLTFRHWAGLSPYTSTLAALAGTGVFGKQTPGPGHCGPLTLGTAWVPHATRGAPSPEVTGPICRVP